MRLQNSLLRFSLISFLLFILYSYLVAKELFSQFDFDFMVKLQDKIPHTLDPFLSMFSFLGNAEITVGLAIVLAFYSFYNKAFMGALGWLGIIPATLIEVLGKLFIYHPAPSIEFLRTIKTTHLPSFYIHTEYSYPSGHVTRTAFLVVVFLIIVLTTWKNKHYKIVASFILILFLFLMILSRISLGEHWGSDVLGGLILGTSAALFCGSLILRKKLFELKQN